MEDLWGSFSEMIETFIAPLVTQESPREIIALHFSASCGELPISGGWGYTQDDACVIDKNDRIVNVGIPFDGIGLEYVFVQKRIYEEMIITRPKGEQYSGIHWKLKTQTTINEGVRQFDRLEFDVTALLDEDWEALKTEYEGADGYGTPSFDEDAHKLKRQEKMVHLTSEYWFDITSFLGGR